MVNGVNLMNMMYAANGKKVKRSKVTFDKTEQVKVKRRMGRMVKWVDELRVERGMQNEFL